MKLQGFNNLTKSLRINLYWQHKLETPHDHEDFRAAVHRHSKAGLLEEALQHIAACIEARVLTVSAQDYAPWGASALLLLSDVGSAAVDMHLNKSHLCAHTYPDIAPGGQSACLRLDLDLASCGTISPLRALDFVLDRFQPHAAVMDYAIRGFTRDASGAMIFQDHPLTQLREILPPAWLDVYEVFEEDLPFSQTWQMKLLQRAATQEQMQDLRKIMQITL